MAPLQPDGVHVTRSLTRTLAVILLCSACGDDSTPPPPPLDTGVRDSSRPGRDSAIDPVDSGADAPMRRDTGAPLDVGFDSNVELMDAATDEDPCRDYIEPGCADCAPGTVCADDVCGGRACIPGRPCLTADDCGGSACIGSDGDIVRGTCAMASLTDCTTLLDCPVGYLCEEGACVNRRLPCFIVADRCPRGYICSFAGETQICMPSMNRCTADSQCEDGFTCVDVDGDGTNECVGAGFCTTNDDCRDDGRCTVEPDTSTSECAVDGACGGGAGCIEGRSCMDLTGGNAAPTCELPGGSCATSADCDEGEVCAAPGLGFAPMCLGGV